METFSRPRWLLAMLAMPLALGACAETSRSLGGPAKATTEPPSPAEVVHAPDPTYDVPSTFPSIAAAVAFIQRHVDVPVVVPDPLPEGTRLVGRKPVFVSSFEGRVHAQLGLRFGESGQITLQYGVAGFDGCGGDSATPTRVGSQPAMINEADPRSGAYPYATVIWPATPDHMEGRYGISATGTGPEVLAMAESMERARVAMGTEEPPGC
jgi:hypothetical protein